MEASLDEVVGHALENVFVVTKPLWPDEKDRASQNTYFPYIKVGTLLTVHAVIITDYGLDVRVRFPFRSMSENGLCGGCPAIEEQTCAMEDDCPNTCAEFDLECLATHCELWEPDMQISSLMSLQ